MWEIHIYSVCFVLQESISTCRFAQRVAMIKNDVLLNEEIDPKLVSRDYDIASLINHTQIC